MIDERVTSTQLSLFIPEPDISGSTNASGRDLWYDRARCMWTPDPFDAWLSDEQLLKKYGTAAPERQPGQFSPD